VAAAAGVVAGFAALLVAAAAVASTISSLDLGTTTTTLAVGAVLSAAYLLAIGAVTMLAHARGAKLAGAVGLRRVGAVPLLLGALSAAVLGRLLAGVWGVVIQLLGVKVPVSDLDPTRLFAPGVPGVIMLVVVAVILAPVTEEMIFRGVLLPAFAHRWGVTAAVAGSSLVFSVIHLTPVALPALFLFALLLGTLFVRTRSLWVCIVSHALFNAIGLAAAYAAKSAGLL
jgi:membrane protease YdiL (CAAX protease family)